MGATIPGIGMVYIFLFILTSCIGSHGEAGKAATSIPDQHTIIDPAGKTIIDRFNPPPGYIREDVDTSLFGFFLRNLELKPYGSKVKYYNGQPKNKPNVYISVVDMDIGDRDLQQCADAVMRLRSEFLYEKKRYQDIHFNFVSDGNPRFYEDFADGDHSYDRFRKYMDYIFSYANTSSLSQELIPVNPYHEMQIGDILIQTGNPYGHAVIVVDLAENPATDEKVFMLAQSYMPAQDIQILGNRKNPGISPWYKLGEDPIETPEWTFYTLELKRFKD